jgi:hypothetical protein
MALERPGSIRGNILQSLVPETDEGLMSLRYEEALLARPSMPVTVPPPPQALPSDTIPEVQISLAYTRQQNGSKRDSGLAPTESTGVREGSVVAGDEVGSTIPANGFVIPITPGTPKITRSDSLSTVSRWKLGSAKIVGRPKTPKTPKTPQSSRSKVMSSDSEFSPITTPIPSDSQLELDFMDQISFSKRGSVLLSGRKFVNGRLRENTRRYVICWLANWSSPDALLENPNFQCLLHQLRGCYRKKWSKSLLKFDPCMRLVYLLIGPRASNL